MAVAALVNAAPSLTLSPVGSVAANLSPSTSAAAAGFTDLLKTKHLTERSLFPSDEPTVQARRFFCRTGYFLQIWPDGTVNGSYSSTSKFGVLEFITTMTFLTNISSPSINLLSGKGKPQTKFSIRGSETNLWLCMNRYGSLYASDQKTSECEFQETEIGNRRRSNWSVYYSTKYPKDGSSDTRWYIAFDRKTGQPLQAMTDIKKMSKCSTKGVIDSSGPSLKLPMGGSLFTTQSPLRTKSQSIYNTNSKNTSSKPRGGRSRSNNKQKTYTREGRGRDQSAQSAEEVELTSLESLLLNRYSHNIFSSTIFNTRKNTIYNPATGDKVRHPNSRQKNSNSSWRRTYSRHQSYERLDSNR